MNEEMRDLATAMRTGDVLAEAERRYEIIANMLDPQREIRDGDRGLTGTEVKALSIEADRLMLKIVALRAERDATAKDEQDQAASGDADKLGKVVAFDAGRFRKSS